MAHTDRARLAELLRERNEHPERIPEIDEAIRAAFAVRAAVLVIDMAGFSRLSMRYGITHFLAMIRRMHDLVRPVIHDPVYGGHVFKAEADNVFARFESPTRAVRAALAIRREVLRVNRVLPEDWDLYLGMGIGFGELLLLDAEDAFGNEMNLASKLGEDVAEPGQILLTEAAAEALEPGRFELLPRERHLGDHTIRYRALLHG